MKGRFAMLVLAAMTAPVLGQWISLPTPGIPRTADGAPDLSAPAPRAADGNPDLSGLWYPVEVTGSLVDPANAPEWARLLMTEREARFLQDAPRFRCLPSGPGSLTLSGRNSGTRRIVQHPNLIAVLNADLTYRQIFTDGRELEPDPHPIWTGYSVGRWEGDTLVVESNGYNDKTWLHARGLPHSDRLRITERYRRPDFGRIRLDVTYEDPETFDAPLHAVVELEFVADDEMLEVVCQRGERGAKPLGAATSRSPKSGPWKSIRKSWPDTWAPTKDTGTAPGPRWKSRWKTATCFC